jgi:hypothetical protein
MHTPFKGARVTGLPDKLNYHGTVRSLAHLAPFSHRIAGHGLNGTDIALRVSFESHVYSRSDGDRRHDFLDESGNRRWFCSDRYDVSLTLADEVRRMIDQNVYSWETRDRNRVANLAVLNPASQQLVSGRHNVAIYYLFAGRVPGIDVEMVVKTCYAMTVDFSRIRTRHKVRSLIKTVCFKGGRLPKG